MDAARKDRGINRIRDKLNLSLESKNYYESHQLYKTLYFRLKDQNRYDELLQLLESGSELLLKNGQKESGADLAILFIDVLVKSSTPVTEEWISKVTNLFALMNPTMPERETYVASATRWSMGGSKVGHPSFHGQMAKIFLEQKNHLSARQHFLRSTDGKSFASMVIEIHTTKGLPSEVDLFLAQAVFQCLCVRSYDLAVDFFVYYTTNHPAIKRTELPYTTPLINYVYFVLKCIEMKRTELFKEILVKYDPIVKLDPSYAEYLDKIGHMYFQIPRKPKNKANGLFGNLFQSIIGGLTTESSDDEEPQPGSSGLMQGGDLE